MYCEGDTTVYCEGEVGPTCTPLPMAVGDTGTPMPSGADTDGGRSIIGRTVVGEIGGCAATCATRVKLPVGAAASSSLVSTPSWFVSKASKSAAAAAVPWPPPCPRAAADFLVFGLSCTIPAICSAEVTWMV